MKKRKFAGISYRGLHVDQTKCHLIVGEKIVLSQDKDICSYFYFLDKDKDELGFRNMRIINQDHVLKLVRRLISTSLEKL
jgi:hypothetical protein